MMLVRRKKEREKEKVFLVPSSPLHLVVFDSVVLLTRSQAFARQGLLVAFLDLDVAALELECSRECAAGPHAGEVFGCVDGKDVAQHLGEYGREAANVQVHGIDAHQDESEAVFAMSAT